MAQDNVFGNLVNTRLNIEDNFNTVEKSIELIKTEKELYDKISSSINLLNQRIGEIEGMKKEFMTMIGSQPIKERYYYMSNNNDIVDSDSEVMYLIYDVDDVGMDKVREDSAITNFTVESQKVEDENLQMKIKYNELCRKYFRVKEKIEELESYKRNLKSNSKRTFKFNLRELTNFGF